MAIVLFLWGIACGFVGFMFFASAKSAIHEIEAGLCFLTATGAIGCAAITSEVKLARDAFKAAKDSPKEVLLSEEVTGTR